MSTSRRQTNFKDVPKSKAKVPPPTPPPEEEQESELDIQKSESEVEEAAPTKVGQKRKNSSELKYEPSKKRPKAQTGPVLPPVITSNREREAEEEVKEGDKIRDYMFLSKIVPLPSQDKKSSPPSAAGICSGTLDTEYATASYLLAKWKEEEQIYWVANHHTENGFLDHFLICKEGNKFYIWFPSHISKTVCEKLGLPKFPDVNSMFGFITSSSGTFTQAFLLDGAYFHQGEPNFSMLRKHYLWFWGGKFPAELDFYWACKNEAKLASGNRMPPIPSDLMTKLAWMAERYVFQNHGLEIMHNWRKQAERLVKKTLIPPQILQIDYEEVVTPEKENWESLLMSIGKGSAAEFIGTIVYKKGTTQVKEVTQVAKGSASANDFIGLL